MNLRKLMLAILCSCAVISCTGSQKIPPEWGERDRSYSTSTATGCPSMGGRYRNQAEWAATNPELLSGISSREEFNLDSLFLFKDHRSEVESVKLSQFIEDKHKLRVSFLDSRKRNIKDKEFELDNFDKNISVQCNRDSIVIHYSVVTPTQTGASFFDHKTIYLERSNDGSLIVTIYIYRSPIALLVRKPSVTEYLLRFEIVKA